MGTSGWLRIVLICTTNHWGSLFLFFFTDKETDAHRLKVICPGSHHWPRLSRL